MISGWWTTATAAEIGFTNSKGQTLHTLQHRNELCRGLSGLKHSTSLHFSLCQEITEIIHCYSSLEWESACPSDFPDWVLQTFSEEKNLVVLFPKHNSKDGKYETIWNLSSLLSYFITIRVFCSWTALNCNP